MQSGIIKKSFCRFITSSTGRGNFGYKIKATLRGNFDSREQVRIAITELAGKEILNKVFENYLFATPKVTAPLHVVWKIQFKLALMPKDTVGYKSFGSGRAECSENPRSASQKFKQTNETSVKKLLYSGTSVGFALAWWIQ